MNKQEILAAMARYKQEIDEKLEKAEYMESIGNVTAMNNGEYKLLYGLSKVLDNAADAIKGMK